MIQNQARFTSTPDDLSVRPQSPSLCPASEASTGNFHE